VSDDLKAAGLAVVLELLVELDADRLAQVYWHWPPEVPPGVEVVEDMHFPLEEALVRPARPEELTEIGVALAAGRGVWRQVGVDARSVAWGS
jgi:hypothetical protein